MSLTTDTSNIAAFSVTVDQAESPRRVIIDHAQLRSYESVMAELLMASTMTRRRRLSLLAERELQQSGNAFTAQGLVATAKALRGKCVALGMPDCRYRDQDWRRRGF